jgi:hypothetical protein
MRGITITLAAIVLVGGCSKPAPQLRSADVEAAWTEVDSLLAKQTGTKPQPLSMSGGDGGRDETEWDRAFTGFYDGAADRKPNLGQRPVDLLFSDIEALYAVLRKHGYRLAPRGWVEEHAANGDRGLPPSGNLNGVGPGRGGSSTSDFARVRVILLNFDNPRNATERLSVTYFLDLEKKRLSATAGGSARSGPDAPRGATTTELSGVGPKRTLRME